MTHLPNIKIELVGGAADGQVLAEAELEAALEEMMRWMFAFGLDFGNNMNDETTAEHIEAAYVRAVHLIEQALTGDNE